MEQATPQTRFRFSVQQAMALLAGVVTSAALIPLGPHLNPHKSVFSQHSARPAGTGVARWLSAYENVLTVIGHFPWNLLLVALVIFLWVRTGFIRKHPLPAAFLIGWCLGWLAQRWLS